MDWLRRLVFCAVTVVSPNVLPAGTPEFEAAVPANWHQWRGPQANGVSRTANPPTAWSETQNIRWKVALSGEGNATPIVWKDQLFLLSAVKTDKVDPNRPKAEDQPDNDFGIKLPNNLYDFVVTCLDRNTGKELWRQVAHSVVPGEGHHPDNTFASASPMTDGEQLYCWFGSQGLFCYDLAGNKLWERQLGQVITRRGFGEGASPVVHDGKLIVVRDQEQNSYIVCLDAKTGETLWQKPRDEITAWATPLVVERNGVTQLITSATNRVRSYNLETGDVIWECGGQVTNVTPCPVVKDDIVYCMSGYRGAALFAIPLDSIGDITGTDKIKWKLDQGTPYVPSPILYDDYLYFNQSNNGILTCVDANTGKVLIERTRIPLRGVYASPVGAQDRIYFLGRDGECLVMEKAPQLKTIAVNKLDDLTDASPALVGNQIFIRGDKSLYCISEN